MKKLLLLSFFIALLLSGCTLLDTIPNNKVDPVKGAGAITLKIVQINDVYEIAPLNGGEYGGLARVAYIRDSIKQKFPNTYLFLAGDFLNPSLLGTIKVDGERLNGKHMIDVLNAMEIDLVTFGNHEFDLSEEDLQKRLDESTFKWMSSNTRHATENSVKPFTTKWEYTNLPIADYITFNAADVDGNKIKLGVFGVTTPSNPKEYVFYEDIYQSSVRAYEEAITKADIVVGLTHVSVAEDIEIAKRIRDLPLIMGGHEHFNMLLKEGRTIIAKADANAKSVYVHTLQYNLRTKHLYLNSDLVYVGSDTQSSAKVERVVNKWDALLGEKLKEVVDSPNEIIFTSNAILDGTDETNRSSQSNLGDIITKAMTNAFGRQVDGAIVNGGSIRIDDNLQGNITSTDVFRILPFGGSVLKVELKGSLLTQVLDYGEQKKGTGAYLQRNNFSQDSDGVWSIGGTPIRSNRNYTIALSDFLMKGLDIPFLTPDNSGVVKIYTPKENETAADIRKVIITYLKKS
jgi:2',3'-cyclic-nucleotide 2'-phosphodiesterase (5'-nucleotidase family)